MCSLSSFTRYRPSGRSSVTVPSNSRNSSFSAIGVFSLERLQIACGELAALAVLFQLVGELLAFPDAAEARALNRRDMHENVRAAVVGLNEAIALRGVEPLHSTCRHLAYLIIRASTQGSSPARSNAVGGDRKGGPDSTEIEKGITRPTGRYSMPQIWTVLGQKQPQREPFAPSHM